MRTLTGLFPLFVLALLACDRPGQAVCNDDGDCGTAVCLGGICTVASEGGEEGGEGEGKGEAVGEAEGEGEGEAVGEGGEGEGEGEGEVVGEGEGEGEGDVVGLSGPASIIGRAGEPVRAAYSVTSRQPRRLVAFFVDGVGGAVSVEAPFVTITPDASGSGRILRVEVRPLARDATEVLATMDVDVTIRPADWAVLSAPFRVVATVAPGAPGSDGSDAGFPVRVDVDGPDGVEPLSLKWVAANGAELSAARDSAGLWWVRPESVRSGDRFLGYPFDGTASNSPFFDYDAVFHFDGLDDVVSGAPLIGADPGTATVDVCDLGPCLVFADTLVRRPATVAAPSTFVTGASALTINLRAVIDALPAPGFAADVLSCSSGPGDSARLVLSVVGSELRLLLRPQLPTDFEELVIGPVAVGTIDVVITVVGPDVRLALGNLARNKRATSLPFSDIASARCVVGGDEELNADFFNGRVDELRVTRGARPTPEREQKAMSAGFISETTERAP